MTKWEDLVRQVRAFDIAKQHFKALVNAMQSDRLAELGLKFSNVTDRTADMEFMGDRFRLLVSSVNPPEGMIGKVSIHELDGDKMKPGTRQVFLDKSGNVYLAPDPKNSVSFDDRDDLRAIAAKLLSD